MTALSTTEVDVGIAVEDMFSVVSCWWTGVGMKSEALENHKPVLLN